MQVTAIVYGNPQWEPEHGGCLRIWAPPGSQVAQLADEAHARGASPQEVSPRAASAADPVLSISSVGPLREALKLGSGGGEADTAAVPAGCSATAGGPRGATADACSSGAHESSRQSTVSVQYRIIDGEVVVDVEPQAGRLVLLLSGAVDHAVLPAREQRVALTAWCQ